MWVTQRGKGTVCVPASRDRWPGRIETPHPGGLEGGRRRLWASDLHGELGIRANMSLGSQSQKVIPAAT